MIEAKNKQLESLGLKKISVGLRINPLFSEVSPLIYNPCAPFSRLGITLSAFKEGVAQYGLDGIDGLHFHTHCEQDSKALQKTLESVTRDFGEFIYQMAWLNLGGGHHITKDGYNINLLIELIKNLKDTYNDMEIFLEPGEAVGWESGFLIGEVVDIVFNEKYIAILDVSASAHMPDCLEMPYRPAVSKISYNKIESDKGENNATYCYTLAGATCLAGDVIGKYSFETSLNIGDKIIFEDMLHYTIVKNNTFNGIALPSLSVIDTKGKWRLLKTFDYSDYKERN